MTAAVFWSEPVSEMRGMFSMMNAAVALPLRLQARTRGFHAVVPRWRRMSLALLALVVIAAASTLGSTLLHLNLPAPTGDHAVGKAVNVIEDPSRAVPATVDETDRRVVRLFAWYPAQPGTGERAAYVEDLDRIGDGLVASGSIGALERVGLGFVSTTDR